MKLITTVLVAGLLLIATPAHALPRSEQCRFEQVDRAKSTHTEVVKTVRCIGREYRVVTKALRVGDCESSLTAHDFVGPYFSTYQYLDGTFHSHQHMIPVQVHRYQLSHRVRNMRANVITAVIWASKHGWGPWSCA